MKKTFVIVLANDMLPPGREIGPVTKARCDTAIDHYFRVLSGYNRENVFFLTSAGMASEKHFPEQRVPFGWMQRQYMEQSIATILENDEWAAAWCQEHILTPMPSQCYWNTRSEIMNALRHILLHTRQKEECEVILITSDYHMFRTRHIVFRDELRRIQPQLFGRKLHISCFGIKDGNWCSRLWELPKIANELLRCLKPYHRRWNTVQPKLSPF